MLVVIGFDEKDTPVYFVLQRRQAKQARKMNLWKSPRIGMMRGLFWCYQSCGYKVPTSGSAGGGVARVARVSLLA